MKPHGLRREEVAMGGKESRTRGEAGLERRFVVESREACGGGSTGLSDGTEVRHVVR